MADKEATRVAYGRTLAALGEKYDFYVLDADLSGSTQTKIFADKFEWMTQCATFAKAAIEFLPQPDLEEFYTTATESDEGAPGARKVTNYDAPDGVPSTAQALGMTVEEKEADAPRVSKTRLAAAPLSSAIIEVDDKRAAEIRKAFKPMILPIWGGEE